MSVARVVQKAARVLLFKGYTITAGATAQKALKADAAPSHQLSIVITNDDAAEVLNIGFDNTVTGTHKTKQLAANDCFEIAIDEGNDVWVYAATTAHAYTVTIFGE